MEVLTFDTLKFVKRLEAAGVVAAHAEAQVEALAEICGAAVSRLATRDDLKGFATRADLERFATKADLERFATKADLKGFATKEDLERFATKEDLKGFATKADLERFATKEDLKAFATKEDLKGFVTREEFAALRAEMRWRFKQLQWMFGILVGANVALLVKAFG